MSFHPFILLSIHPPNLIQSCPVSSYHYFINSSIQFLCLSFVYLSVHPSTHFSVHPSVSLIRSSVIFFYFLLSLLHYFVLWFIQSFIHTSIIPLSIHPVFFPSVLCLFIHRFHCPSTYSFVHHSLFVCPPLIFLSIHPPFLLSTCQSIHPFLCLSIHLSFSTSLIFSSFHSFFSLLSFIHPSFHLLINSFIHPVSLSFSFIHHSIYLFILLSILQVS